MYQIKPSQIYSLWNFYSLIFIYFFTQQNLPNTLEIRLGTSHICELIDAVKGTDDDGLWQRKWTIIWRKMSQKMTENVDFL